MSPQKILILLLLVALTGVSGCKDPNASAKKKKNEGDAAGIFGKTTRKIGEYKEADGKRVSDGKMKSTNPLNPLGAMNAYQPAVEKAMKLKIQYALRLYQAEKGRFPKSFEEFQTGVMDKWVDTPLPVLPGGWTYAYDVKNHELVIVKEDDGDNTPKE